MIQQINLYNQLPRRSRIELTREMAILIIIIMIIFLIIVYTFQKVAVIRLTKTLETVSAKTAILKTQLDSLNAKYPLDDITTLKKSVSELEVKLEHKNNLINLLLPNAVFSSYLLAFANTNVPGLWLTAIKIVTEQQKVDLNGLTLASNSVEKFLGQLATQPVFLNTIHFELDDLSDTTVPSVFHITNKIESVTP